MSPKPLERVIAIAAVTASRNQSLILIPPQIKNGNYTSVKMKSDCAHDEVQFQFSDFGFEMQDSSNFSLPISKFYLLHPFFVSSNPSNNRPAFGPASVSSRCGWPFSTV